MKNAYPKEVLEDIYSRYKELKDDSEYLMFYSANALFEYIWDMYPLFLDVDKELRNEVLEPQLESRMATLNKWGLRVLISPYLRIKKKSLYVEYIKAGTPLAKIIYAFNLSSDPKLLGKSEESKKKVSKETETFDLETKKLFCWFSWNATRGRRKPISYSRLGRIFGVDDETIKKWIEEINSKDENTKHHLISEFFIQRKFKEADVLDLHHKKLYSYEKMVESGKENQIVSFDESESGRTSRKAKRLRRT